MTELWELEQRFWRGGVSTYEKYLADEALLVTPPPTGILDRAGVVSAIRAADRWASVDISERHVGSHDNAVFVLAYRVLARKDAASPAYQALCSSTYVATRGGWRMLAHQQTPVPD